MNRDTLESALSEHRRTLLSLVLTVLMLGSLAAAAMPSSAVETTVTGPDEVDRNDRMTVTATIDLQDGERVPVEAFQFTLSPSDTDGDEPLTVTFAPNGTVLDVTPERGTINRGDIRIRQFTKSLEITPVSNSASYGYGYRSGYDERAGLTREYGYGYGFGYGTGDATEFEYEIAFDATALDRETFSGRVGVDTGDETSFVSDEFQFEVVRPSHDWGDGWDKWNKNRHRWNDWDDRRDWNDRHDWDDSDDDHRDWGDSDDDRGDDRDDHRGWDDRHDWYEDRYHWNDARHHWFDNWDDNRHYGWGFDGGVGR
ncbi:hypothetical protein ACFQJC_05700 [Haloferax namakaokahaiae]|uniref:Uncharacterized protein n=1 Tax=Haloferax namakaokahaiae TaxID=1748331 RepID=A0ABD5ZCP9_9EURY